MAIIPALLNWINTKRLYQIDLFRQYPLEVQRDMLLKLIQNAENTDFGKRYKFNDIHSIADFQKLVPISNYDDFKEWIERAFKGEPNVCWPGKIKWFAKSSGTTSDKSKFIPVSNEALEDNHFRCGKDIFAFHAKNYPDNMLFSGKILTLGGSHQINEVNQDSFFGDLSAILMENTPYWVYFSRTPSHKVAVLDNWEQKLDQITKQTTRENVTGLMGVPSWNLVMIKHLIEQTNSKSLLDIWPNLELFIHGGINFSPYKEMFKSLIPSEGMRYMETYNASEGFFAIQDDPSKDDMLLILDAGVFYEFIEFHDFINGQMNAIPISEVKVGSNYAMIISTNAGLWRYQIGDTVSFTSLYPHKIKITGRTKLFINAFGEELIIDNAESALKKACDKTGSLINEYTVAPVYMTNNSKGRHQWLVEFEKQPENINYFITVLDNALKALNSDYEAKRYMDITLDTPELIVAPKGTFYQWLKQKEKLGGQNKVPRLSNNRDSIDEILKIMHHE